MGVNTMTIFKLIANILIIIFIMNVGNIYGAYQKTTTDSYVNTNGGSWSGLGLSNTPRCAGYPTYFYLPHATVYKVINKKPCNVKVFFTLGTFKLTYHVIAGGRFTLHICNSADPVPKIIATARKRSEAL